MISIFRASGRRPGGARRWRASSAGANCRPTRSSAATTRSRAAPRMRLRERGIAVPDGVSIVGFDNWAVMAEASRPPLTSVDMNLNDLGRRAGQSLLECIGGKRLRGVERLPCTLVVRRSCGAGAALLGRKTDNSEGQFHAPATRRSDSTRSTLMGGSGASGLKRC